MQSRSKTIANTARQQAGPFLLVLDILCIVALYYGALFFRYEEAISGYQNLPSLIIILCTTLFTVYLVDGYHVHRHAPDFRYYSEYLIACFVNFLGALSIIYFFTNTAAARLIVGSTLLLYPFFSIFYRRWFSLNYLRNNQQKAIWVIGVNHAAQTFYRKIKQDHWPHEFLFFDPQGKQAGQPLIPEDPTSPTIKTNVIERLSGETNHLETIVLAAGPDEMPAPLVEWLVAHHYLELHVQTLDNFYTAIWKTEPLERVSPYWAFEDGFRLNQSYSFERIKRVFDIFASLSMILAFSPIWITAAVAIKLESRGPVFFRQSRMGLGQSIFTVFKFRSMYEGSETGDIYTRSGDARISHVGLILRKTRFDELPQLINVLRGEMSLIGPRPEWDLLAKRYMRSIPYYHFRHLVKPGITGWAQVNYPYGESEQDAIEKLKYDLYYVRYYSLMLDLSICLKTIYVMFFGKGQ